MSNIIPIEIKKVATKRRRAQPVNKVVEDWAKLDPSIFALSLFRPHKKGQAVKYQVEGVYNGEHIKVVAPFGLDAPELSILLAIVSMAGQKTEIAISSQTHSPTHFDNVAGLKPNELAVASDHVILKTTESAIMTAAGLTNGGKNYKIFENLLERLRVVHYVRHRMEGNQLVKISGAGEQLLFYKFCADSREIIITVSEHLSRALITKMPFDMLWMPDYRALKGAVARILLTRLTVLTRPRTTKRYRLDDLIAVVYGEDPATMPDQKVRDRRRALRAGLEELGALDSWFIFEDHRTVYEIRRLREKGVIVEDKGVFLMQKAVRK